MQDADEILQQGSTAGFRTSAEQPTLNLDLKKLASTLYCPARQRQLSINAWMKGAGIFIAPVLNMVQTLVA